MKPEEAIKVITQPIYIQGMRQGKTAYGEAITEAVKALEKQIPIKPILFQSAWMPYYECDCRYTINFSLRGDYKHCPNCGQKLDWSEEE